MDYGLTPSPYIVMEYFDGTSLDEILKADQISEKTATDIFEQLCYGLQAAHGAGLIHRDLKPSNVLIATQSGNYRAKLLDFGIAKIVQSNSDQNKLTATGEILGSPPYMSPEQWTARSTDQRSDIYSLGCLMYEVVSGHPIFEGASSFEYLNLHLTEEPKQFAEVAPARKISPGLESIIRACLQKDPQDRYSSTEELLEDISCFKEGKQLKTRSKIKRSPKSKVSDAKRAVLVALIVPLAVAGVMFACRFQIAEACCQHLNQQGAHYQKTNRANEAISYYRQSLSIGQFLPQQDRQRLEAMQHLLVLLSKQGQFDEAQRIKERLKKEIGDIQPDNWDDRASLEERLLMRHKFAEAEKLARENLSLAEQIAGKQSVLYARSLDNLGAVLRGSGRGKEAVTLQEEALSLTSRLLEPDSLFTSKTLNDLGLAYRAAKRPLEAQEAFEKAIAISNRQSTPELGLANQYYNLAGLFLEQGEYAKAIVANQKSYELDEQLGGSSANAIKNRSGMIYQRMRRYDDAIKEFEEGLRLRKTKGTLNTTKANHDYYNLGLCYERTGQLQKAAENYQKCMDTYKISGTEPDSYYPMFKQSYDKVSALLRAKGEQTSADGK